MPVDTSSFYPEVPSNEGKNNEFSLNNRHIGLFGDSPLPPEEKQVTETAAETGASIVTEPKTSVNSAQEEPQKTEMSGAGDGSGCPKKQDDTADEPPTFAGRLAEILSWVLTPLFMPVYGLILAFTVSILQITPMSLRVVFTLIVAGICVVIPMLLIVLLKKLKVVSDLGLNKQGERPVPYIITSMCFFAAGWFMATKGAPMWLTMFFAGGATAGVINLVINYWWKISAHAAGIAGIVALLIRIAKDGNPMSDLIWWLIAVIIVAGLLGSARVYLCRHTVWQVLAGYVVGFCSVFFLTML